MGKGAEQAVFDTIAAEKDVDGFGAESVGLLVQNRPKLVACTPSGVIELLEREQIPIAGRHAVVIGRSDIVGKPMALLLLHRDATVTICHSKTPNLPEMCRQADILVAAVGRPGMVTMEFVKPGATVIDVGINRVSDAALASRLFAPGSAKLGAFQSKGSVLVGDVHPNVADVAGALTPVPGGIGPLTITMLMHNTLRAAKARVHDSR
jgi:methylenetetrahydrofolate dehydrogenase (NADP+)/methenyltetrahydrofolate cyclohydrolase